MTRPPNLLFVFTDEQRYDTMAAYGNTKTEMPNLNRLASQSVVFERAYVTQPVCTPSRATIMTGLYPHTNGCTENNIPLSADIPCFPEMLRSGAYATAYHGKWHLGDEIFCQHGFDEFRSIEDNYIRYYGEGRDPEARSTYHHWLVENGFTPSRGTIFGRGETARFPEAYGKPAYLAREASRYIREHQDEPFVLYVNFLEPHMPFFGPRDDQYDPAEVSLPENFQARLGEIGLQLEGLSSVGQ
jgi:arylsulfatase A-like enzyme